MSWDGLGSVLGGLQGSCDGFGSIQGGTMLRELSHQGMKSSGAIILEESKGPSKILRVLEDFAFKKLPVKNQRGFKQTQAQKIDFSARQLHEVCFSLRGYYPVLSVAKSYCTPYENIRTFVFFPRASFRSILKTEFRKQIHNKHQIPFEKPFKGL